MVAKDPQVPKFGNRIDGYIWDCIILGQTTAFFLIFKKAIELILAKANERQVLVKLLQHGQLSLQTLLVPARVFCNAVIG